MDEHAERERRNQRVIERSKRKQRHINAQFAKEAAQVERLERVVRARQQALVRVALENCCALLIQAVWRGYSARCRARAMRAERAAKMIAAAWIRKSKQNREAKLLQLYMKLLHRLRLYRKHGAARTIQCMARASSAKSRVQAMKRLLSRAEEHMIELIMSDSAFEAHRHRCAGTIQREWRHRRSAKKLKGKAKKRGTKGHRAGKLAVVAAETIGGNTFVTQGMSPSKASKGGALCDPGGQGGQANNAPVASPRSTFKGNASLK
ncbi:unnamed protein product [Chrysoparadoxa australica]